MTKDELIGILSGRVTEFCNGIRLPDNSYNREAIGKLISESAEDIIKAIQSKSN